MGAQLTDTDRPRGRGLRGWLQRLLPQRGPDRVLVLSTLIASIGSGLYISGSAVYFVSYVGLSATQVGIGLSIGGFGGLVLGPFLGHAADRIGPRTATMIFTASQVVMLVAAGLVHSFWPFVVVVALLGVADAGEAVSRGALVAAVVGREGRVRLSAYMRSVLNLGFTFGVFLAGLALAINTRPAYLALIWGHAFVLVVVTTIYLALPHTPGTPKQREQSKMRALRDLPYFAVAQVSGITRLGDTVLTIGLPLWIVNHTDAPRAVAAWIVGLNTVLIVLFQVWAARGADTLPGAVRIQRWSFLVLAAACVIVGTTGSLASLAAVAALAVAVVCISFGEMWGEGARWSLRYELAPDNAQGQYGGVFRLGQFVPIAVGPLMVTSFTDRLEEAGWLIIAAVFLVGLLLNRLIVGWAMRTREAGGHRE